MVSLLNGIVGRLTREQDREHRMDWDPKRQEKEAVERVRSIGELESLLTTFLADPTEYDGTRNWVEGIRKYCPLWALQQPAYRDFQLSDEKVGEFRLVKDLNWRIMDRASQPPEDLAEEFASLGSPQVFSVREGPDKRQCGSFLAPTVQLPNKEVAEGYLANCYREAIRNYLKYQDGRWIDDTQYGPEDPIEDDPVIEKLRDLVTSRDLAKISNKQVTTFLQEIGALRIRGQKTNLPFAEQFINALGKECRIWLPVLAACEDVRVSQTAIEKLRSWNCADDAESMARRLAFPFLNPQELANVRSNTGTNHDLTAVRLIHARLNPIRGLGTVAKDAFGGTFHKSNRTVLQSNPFLA